MSVESVDQQIAASLQPTKLTAADRKQFESAPVPEDDDGVFDRTAFGGGGDVLRGTNNVNPRAKEARRRLARLLAYQFVKAGGAITVCPPSKHTPKELIKPRWWRPPIHPRGRPSRLQLRPPRQCAGHR
jgi:hypothetical protein